MMASLTLQCLSSASSTIAGSKDWESRSIPITCMSRKEYNKHDVNIVKQDKQSNVGSTDLIDLIQLANDIEANIREFVFQKGQKYGKKLFDCCILRQPKSPMITIHEELKIEKWIIVLDEIIMLL